MSNLRNIRRIFQDQIDLLELDDNDLPTHAESSLRDLAQLQK